MIFYSKRRRTRVRGRVDTMCHQHCLATMWLELKLRLVLSNRNFNSSSYDALGIRGIKNLNVLLSWS
jgi:hypothetical protein